MTATTLTSRRKVIDIKGDTFRSLSVLAASEGTNLKCLIERLLDHVAEEYDDNKLYSLLSDKDPDGKVMANAKEKEKFENWLGV